MTDTETTELIQRELRSLSFETPINKEIYSENINNNKNEFLFFIKPELTLTGQGIKFKRVLNLILNKFEEYSFRIKNIRLINANYLAKYKIINAHYGIISKLSSDLKRAITESAKRRFNDIYKTSFDRVEVYGSLEFLKEFPLCNTMGLSLLCQNILTEKIGGGTYITKIKFDGRDVYIVNGFHPRQLEHFTSDGRSIVVMKLTSDTDWKTARQKLIGSTNPHQALPGSIRRELLDNKDNFGLQMISPSWNGVHLSAGPLESLIELMRYDANIDVHQQAIINNYGFGSLMLKAFGKRQTAYFLSNPNVLVNGIPESIFDLTEEQNSDTAIELLRGLARNEKKQFAKAQ